MKRGKGGLRRPKRKIIRRTFKPPDPLRPLPERRGWYVLIISPKREYQVATWLEEHSWHALVPIERRMRAVTRHGRGRTVKRQAVELPLIPRIVIVGVPNKTDLALVMDNYHILGVLGVNEEPARIHKGELKRLQATSAALLAPRVAKPVLPGTRARMVAHGLFVGHIVEVHSITGKWATVIQSWFGSPREVRVAVDDLEAA